METPVKLLTEWTNASFKKKDLRSGVIYILKNGEVRLYLGINKVNGQFMFYILGQTYVEEIGWQSDFKMLHGDLQATLLLNMCQQILRGGFSLHAIKSYVSIPELRCAWYQAYTSEQLEKLCRRYVLADGAVSNILQQITFTGDATPLPSPYVTAKDLKPGAVYFTGAFPQGATYVYIGRLANKGFVWVFIGNAEAWNNDPCEYVAYFMKDVVFVNQQNKKARLLSSIPISDCDSESSQLYGRTYDIKEVREIIEIETRAQYGSVGKFV